MGGEATFQLLRRSRTSIIPLHAIDNGHTAGDVPSSGRSSNWPRLSAEQNGRDAAAWQADRIDYERHSKFTLISDPLPLWVQTVGELAKLGVQVRCLVICYSERWQYLKSQAVILLL